MPKIIPIICTQCGEGFEAVKNGAGRLPRACSDVCKRDRANMLRRMSPKKPPPMRAGVCAICSGAFEAHNSKTVTCGARCGGIYSSRRRVEEAARRKARTCECCGKFFIEGSRSATQRAGGKRQRFCSRACATKAR